MPKKAELAIKETESELIGLKGSQSSLGLQKRVLALMRIKQNKDQTRMELANYLGIHIRTLERWVRIYQEKGIQELLSIKPRRVGSKIITAQIHEGLSNRVHDPHNSFLGYWDAQRWIKTEYGVDVKYQRVREYLIKHFGTSLKSTRKSHTNKDEQAIGLFKKPT